MKKLLLSTVALAGLTAGAMAADLPARRMAPAPFAAVPVFTWTGFYVGANVGAGWNGNNNNGFNGNFFNNGNLVATSAGLVTAPVVPATGNFGFGNGFGGNNNNDVGILGGVQVGYNWQVAPGNGFVIGVEADVQAIGNRNNRNNGFVGLANGGLGVAVPSSVLTTAGAVIPTPTAANPANVAFFNNGGLNFNGNNGNGGDWFATARIRVGYAFDRFMIYGTGGVAFKDDRNRNGNFGGGGFSAVPAAFFVPGAVAGPGLLAGPGFVTNGNSNNNVGWAAGVGGEWAFTNNLSAKIEYLHLGFDRGNRNNFLGNSVVGVTSSGAAITSTGNGFGFGNNRGNRGTDLVRVGLNFRFNGM
jgi:outer membrane immunogenic protein